MTNQNVSTRLNERKQSQSSTKRSLGTANFAGFKDDNVGVLLQSSCDLLIHKHGSSHRKVKLYSDYIHVAGKCPEGKRKLLRISGNVSAQSS